MQHKNGLVINGIQKGVADVDVLHGRITLDAGAVRARMRARLRFQEECTCLLQEQEWNDEQFV